MSAPPACSANPPRGKTFTSFPSIARIALLACTVAACMQAGAAAAATVKKSIGGWVSCTGTSDDTSGAIKAFAAAAHGTFTLVVDCPVRLHSGSAIDRVIFIDDGTAVEFAGAGKFFVDNVLHPAFVIANSNNISLVNWNVEWDGSLSVNPYTGSYVYGGKTVAAAGLAPPASAFNNIVLADWLETHRSITFDETKGFVKALWAGPAIASAVLCITGDSFSVAVTGMRLYAPPAAGGDHFIPVAFSISTNWKSNQNVNATTPKTAQYLAIPRWLMFSGIVLDGTLMGWLGGAQDTTFENITSNRYGDLQDANGGNVGGIGKWFPPPHLLYLGSNNTGSDPALFTSNIEITGVVDAGPRAGVARDRGAADTFSGYAASLKLGCDYCYVNGYSSTRPDGFMDVLPSIGLTVNNVFAEFDSAFLNNVYPAGVRFPASGYQNVAFENVRLLDTAESTVIAPIGNATNVTNAGITFSNIKVLMNRWAGSDLPVPSIAGLTNSVALDIRMPVQSVRISHLLSGPVSATLSGNPATLRAGASTILSWRSTGAAGCVAGGAWSGTIGTSGTRVVKVGPAGSYAFNLTCRNPSHSASTTLQVVAQ